jgi:tRNA (cytidine/uridine-2'-O-)-methyltransferase|tara:strand:+ start:105 stop:563 length:459 start_codon:yes stop_codon:yes gene_type:complete
MLNVVLFEPEIPPNTGNIGRLCHASGAALHLIEPLGFSLDDKSLKRAGLDYWPELSPTVWPDFDTFLNSVPASASCYYLTTKTTKPYWEATYVEGDYLIFGPETRGLPESLLTSVKGQSLVIPQKRGRSLNLATSAGIVLYEGIRQLEIAKN